MMTSERSYWPTDFGPFGILQAEVRTGIVLNFDGTRRISGSPIQIKPAGSLEDARRIATEIVTHQPDIECSIRDSRGDHVEFIRNKVWQPI